MGIKKLIRGIISSIHLAIERFKVRSFNEKVGLFALVVSIFAFLLGYIVYSSNIKANKETHIIEVRKKIDEYGKAIEVWKQLSTTYNMWQLKGVLFKQFNKRVTIGDALKVCLEEKNEMESLANIHDLIFEDTVLNSWNYAHNSLINIYTGQKFTIDFAASVGANVIDSAVNFDGFHVIDSAMLKAISDLGRYSLSQSAKLQKELNQLCN